MRRPSIFSSNYREQIRRRRINITLIILIIITGTFFGGKYYINKNNIKLSGNSKISGVLNSLKEAGKQLQQSNKEDSKQQVQQNTNKDGAKQNQQQAETQPQDKNISYLEYKTGDGRILKIEYSSSGDKKEITGLKGDSTAVSFDISPDKQRIVFEDKSAGNIVLGDVNNTFNSIQLKEYKSKSSGAVVKQDYTVKNKPWHIWAQKPHFTSDGRVVYVSHLPFVKMGNNLYLWIVNSDGTGHRWIGKLGTDINNISYGGFDDSGRLVIKDGGKTYYLAKGSNRI